MARVVGLDIGSHAVRAAEVNLGDPPELRGFGQVGLPRGAVEHGEVVDPGTVAAAIKRLWRESHIRDRRVRVGLSNLRTIVRQVELPAMENDEELRGAIEFQAGDFIPLPVEEIEIDFRVLESFVSEEGESMSRVLIAAIHRDSLENALVAVREAGLQPVAVDLVPFALVRSLRSEGMAPTAVPEEQEPVDGDEGDESFGSPPAVAEALVSVGSGVTVVVIHEMGVPRFVRIVDSGGDDLTDAIRTTLDLEFEEAELLKRQLPSAPDRADEVRAAMEAPLASLINEIRGSIDFYVSRPEAHPIDRILVTGGAVRTEGLLGRLSEVLPVEAEAADPFVNLQVGDIGFLPEEIENLSPYLPVPVGLALGGDKLAPARVNLLPGGERRVLSTARLAVAGALIVLLLIGTLALLTMQRSRHRGRGPLRGSTGPEPTAPGPDRRVVRSRAAPGPGRRGPRSPRGDHHDRRGLEPRPPRGRERGSGRRVAGVVQCPGPGRRGHRKPRRFGHGVGPGDRLPRRRRVAAADRDGPVVRIALGE